MQVDDRARKIFKGVFDEGTLLTMYRLGRRLQLTAFSGVLKSGKESSVVHAEPHCAVKVYAIGASAFNRFRKYIQGDERFRRVKPDRRGITFAWCQKEFRNLHIAHAAGVRCPKPLGFMANVLAMEFIGEGTTPAPRLADAAPADPAAVIRAIVDGMVKLHRSNLVHGDLSPYNILLHDEQPVFIDFSQGVLRSHPLANELLQRDVRNIAAYAEKAGIALTAEDIHQRLSVPS